MVILSMFDNVSSGSIPANCEACAGYVDGRFPDFDAMVTRFPHLAQAGRVVSIATRPQDTARILDKESGNPVSVEECVVWVRAMIGKGVYRPGVYADASNMPPIRAALSSSGLKRDQYVLWLASWNGIANVPSGYDAHQYTDKAGPNDESACLESFFPPLQASGVARSELSFDLATNHWSLSPLPGDVYWQPTERWATLQIQLGVGGKITGQWRTQPMDWNAKPLGD